MTRRSPLAALAALALVAGSARAQVPVPAPISNDVSQRSGLFTRQVQIVSRLPPDPKRDIWQNGRCARKMKPRLAPHRD